MGEASIITRPIFFIDQSIEATALTEGLRAAGAEIRLHTEVYPGRSYLSDVLWLTDVGRNGWYVLTRDKKILSRLLEKQAMIEARVGLFVFTSGRGSGEDLANIIVPILEDMEQFALDNDRPFACSIDRDGQLRLRNL